MKTYIIAILLFVSNSFFSQYIEGLSVTQNGANQIKMNLKIYLPSEGQYITYTKDIAQNIITLKACYYMGSFGGPAVVTHLINDFFIDIPDNGNYTLKVELYTSGFLTTCDYSNLEDTVMLNFSTPIVGTVSLNAIDIEKKQQKVELYPNPTKDFLTIKTQSKIDQITIFDVAGKKVLTFSEINGNKIEVSKLENGLYFIEIKSNNQIFRNKFLIQK